MAATSSELVLHGLRGDNPLGFFAALGVQRLCTDLKLSWTKDVVPRAVVSPCADIHCLSARLSTMAQKMSNSESISPSANISHKDDGKFDMETGDLRLYLQNSQKDDCQDFAAALRAESYSATDPSHIYFPSGPKRFLTIAKALMSEVTQARIQQDIEKSWEYDFPSKGEKVGTLKWDAATDMSAYALRSEKTPPEFINPGAEMLAAAGFTRFPVFGGFAKRGKRPHTTGCSQSGRKMLFTWPVWSVPSASGAVNSILQQNLINEECSNYWLSSSLERIYQCDINRDKYALGWFSPAITLWQRHDS